MQRSCAKFNKYAGILPFFLAAALLAPPALPDQELSSIRGLVTDPSNKPLFNIQVRLLDKKDGSERRMRTNEEGKFEFECAASDSFALQVLPGRKSGLAIASFDNLPASRHLIVHLKPGFTVTGRIEHAGKGLKGLSISIVPLGSPEGEADKAHGGGETVTSGDGQFRLVLTPGRKKLIVTNERYRALAREAKSIFMVTDDQSLANIELPSASPAMKL